MASIEEKYPDISIREHVLSKDMWSGTKNQIETAEYVIDAAGAGAFRTVQYSPAWLKCIDEPLVNAIDHFEKNYGSAHPVTEISVAFDQSGRVRITNNGPGIEVCMHSGAKMYVPQLLFGEMFRGSNLIKPEGSIIGGTNGVGAKVANIFSTEFVIETVDSERKKYYYQKWTDHMSTCMAPVICDLTRPHNIPNDRVRPHTTLSFAPDYAGSFGYETLSPGDHETLTSVIRTRVYLAANYLKYTNRIYGGKGSVRITFNDAVIPVDDLPGLARVLFPGRQQVHSVLSEGVRAWEVLVVIVENAEMHQLSNVNGIVVREGKHIKYLQNCILAAVRARVTKLLGPEVKFSPSYVLGNIFILANTKIPDPCWTGQRKDVLEIDARKLTQYAPDSKFMAEIATALHDQIMDRIFAKTQPNALTKDKVNLDKYREASKAGGKESHKCALIAVEGDSAMTEMCIGISNNKSMGFEYYGIISLGGVIVNVRKECSVVETKSNKYIKLSNKLLKNEFIKKFVHVMGLNMAYKYVAGPTYKKEKAQLKYGCLIACVDQDNDGIGQIYGLILNLFEVFWPALLREGFVKRFATPIIRAYPRRGSDVKEFYTDEQYRTWGATVDLSNYNVQYYKGLGSHSKEETIAMFAKFNENLFTYDCDERAHDVFEIYYGNDPDLRKKELAQPTKTPDLAKQREQHMTKHINCSDHLEYETNLYQKDNIERKLDSCIDGFNQSARKIYDGSYKAFKKCNQKMKVAQLAGFISQKENYHHGEAGLANSVTGKGFVAVGGKQIPNLIPMSSFGSRLGGGSDAASPRYIYARFNERAMNLIYPPIDYYILDFNFDEGARSEPRYFVPIVPMAIVESTELPGHGWKLKTWGRDIFAIIENVIRLIKNADNTPLLRMPPATHGWNGTLRTIRGEPYSFGKYERRGNKVVITELPLRVWTNAYMDTLRDKLTEGSIVAKVINRSDDINVNIEVTLQPDNDLHKYGDSCFTDPVEEYFQLRARMDSALNMIGAHGEVIEFKSYEEIMHYWFPIRKKYYIARIERLKKLTDLKIAYMQNVIRYATSGLTLAKKKHHLMNQMLVEAGYEQFNKERLYKPKFTPTAELDAAVHTDNCDYLLSLSDLKKSEEAVDGYQCELSRLMEERERLHSDSSERFPGATQWIAELIELQKVVREGIRTNWLFEEYGRFKYGK